jgi:hypothetical protein
VAEQERSEQEKARNKERLLTALFRNAVPGSSAPAPAPTPAPASPDKAAEEEHPGGVGAEAAAAPQPGADAAADAEDAAHAARLREVAVRQLSLLEYSACMGDTEMSVGLWHKWARYNGPVDHGTRFALVFTLHRDDAPSDPLLSRASAVHKALRKVGSLPAHMRTPRSRYCLS